MNKRMPGNIRLFVRYSLMATAGLYHAAEQKRVK
jgi:hypothetical protein